MNDILVAIGLVLAIEGLVWALAPGFAMRLLAIAAQTPPEQLRAAGWMAVATGGFLIWLIRG